jgi:hypothetical protein
MHHARILIFRAQILLQEFYNAENANTHADNARLTIIYVHRVRMVSTYRVQAVQLTVHKNIINHPFTTQAPT